jgi:hypothetical protein
MRLLVDLARLNWTIQEDRFGIELQAPDFLPRSGVGMEEINRSKRAVREELAPLRQAQLQHPATREFIERMENPTRKSGRKSAPGGA